jgi:hypothetical protein
MAELELLTTPAKTRGIWPRVLHAKFEGEPMIFLL